MFSRVAVSVAFVSLASIALAQSPTFDPSPIEKATGMKAAFMFIGVRRRR